MKKKTASMIILGILLFSVLSFAAYAALPDLGKVFRAGLSPIENFFKGGWMKYEKTTAFLLFFFLFFSAYLIGMKTAFKDMTRPHYVFAFAAAFLSAFIIITTLKINSEYLKYIAWGLLILLVFFILYFMLSKLGIENKFWLVLLALLATALLVWFIWWLMHQQGGSVNFGRFDDWLNNLGRETGTGAPTAPGATPPVATPPGGVEVPLKPEGDKNKVAGAGWFDKIGGSGNAFFIAAIVILIIVLLLLRKKKEEKKKDEDEHKDKTPLEKLISILESILNTKSQIQKFVQKLEAEKTELMKRLNGIKEEIQKAEGISNFVNEHLPRLLDKNSEESKGLQEEYKTLFRLFEINKRIAQLYKRLGFIENYIISNIERIRGYVNGLGLDEEKSSKINQLLIRLNDVSGKILSELKLYFEIATEEELTEAKIKELLSTEKIEDRIKSQWLKEEIQDENHLMNLIGKEFELFEKINGDIEIEKRLVEEILRILKGEEERREKILGVISYIDPNDGKVKKYKLRDKVSIGRAKTKEDGSKANDIVLRPYSDRVKNSMIDLVHAIIEKKDGKWYLTDNKTKNETWLQRGGGGKYIEKNTPIELSANDQIRFPGGNFTIIFNLINAEGSAAEEEVDTEVEELPKQLLIIKWNKPKIAKVSPDKVSERGGVPITVNGDNFDEDTEVWLKPSESSEEDEE